MQPWQPGCVTQGWAQERVLVSEVAQGRLLMVLQTDPTNQVKKVGGGVGCVFVCLQEVGRECVHV